MDDSVTAWLFFFTFFLIECAPYFPFSWRGIRSAQSQQLLKHIFRRTCKTMGAAFLFVSAAMLVDTYLTMNRPDNAHGMVVTRNQVRECAFLFAENDCATRENDYLRAECFGLAMCMVQPLYLLSIDYMVKQYIRNLEWGILWFEFYAIIFLILSYARKNVEWNQVVHVQGAGVTLEDNSWDSQASAQPGSPIAGPANSEATGQTGSSIEGTTVNDEQENGGQGGGVNGDAASQASGGAGEGPDALFVANP